MQLLSFYSDKYFLVNGVDLMKKNIKLYNLILPPYLLMVFVPWLAVLSIVGNFLIDSLVLVIISFIIYKNEDNCFKKNYYKKNIWKVYILGFLADFVGAIYLFLGSRIGYAYINNPNHPDTTYLYKLLDAMNDVTNHSDVVTVYSVCFILSAILIASIAIFMFDYFLVFRNADMTKKQKVMSALSFAVCTAPYTFLLPSNLFY